MNTILLLKIEKLADYSGGQSPLLIYLAIVLIIASLTTAAYYYGLRFWSWQEFSKVRNKAQLSTQEARLFKQYIKQFHISDPLPLVVNQKAFDHLMERVARHHHAKKIPEKALLREQTLCNNICHKLDFKHIFQQSPLHSTKALPTDYPVVIQYQDKETRETRMYTAHVVENNSLYLGITPPEEGTDRAFFTGQNPLIDAKFFLTSGATYRFLSRFVRTVNSPEPMWLIQHSNELTHSPAQNLNIETLLLLGQERDALIQVSHITNQDCLFWLAEGEKGISPQSKGLLSIQLEDKSLSLQIKVSGYQEIEGRFRYFARLLNVDPEDHKFLYAFAFQRQKARKVP